MNIIKNGTPGKPARFVDSKFFDNYVAIDWSIAKMSIARMGSNSTKVTIQRDLPGKLKVIKDYLSTLHGTTILTIEESTGAQWLYVELRDEVKKMLICNPSRNQLLQEGPKNDPKDAGDLCVLLRAGMLKEVYHTTNIENYNIRKLVNSYDQLVKSGVRAKNQLSALYRSYGLNYKKDTLKDQGTYVELMIEGKIQAIQMYNEQKKKYETLFNQLKKQKSIIKNLCTLSGIDKTQAVKIFGVVIDPHRFEDKYKFYSYCGLVKYKRESGKSVKRKKNPLYSRVLKSVFKSATLAALRGNNDIREYYEQMLKEGTSPKLAYNTISRYLAKSALAIMKSNIPYKPYSWR